MVGEEGTLRKPGEFRKPSEDEPGLLGRVLELEKKISEIKSYNLELQEWQKNVQEHLDSWSDEFAGVMDAKVDKAHEVHTESFQEFKESVKKILTQTFNAWSEELKEKLKVELPKLEWGEEDGK